MKVYWWQNGLHIEPESEEEFGALKQLFSNSLNLIQITEHASSSPIDGADFGNQDSIVSVHELL